MPYVSGSYRPQDPEATPSLIFDASADLVSSMLSLLKPIESAAVLVEVERTGPFVGGGYTWSIEFKAKEKVGKGEFTSLALTFPTIGVQETSVTGTGARVTIERREAHEAAAAERVVLLAAPRPPEIGEVQVVGCSLTGMTPSEAAVAGLSFVLGFRGEITEASMDSVETCLPFQSAVVVSIGAFRPSKLA